MSTKEKMIRMSIVISPADRESIRKGSEKTGISQSSYVRMLLHEQINQKKINVLEKSK